MQLLFLDESGTSPSPESVSKNPDKNPYFVLGGLIIPEMEWKSLQYTLNSLKDEYGVVGEIKWRYFFPHPSSGKKTPLSHLTLEQINELRLRLFQIVACRPALCVVAAVVDTKRYYETHPGNDAEDMYHDAFGEVCSRFQYYLQDMSRQHDGRPFYGMVVIDERNHQQNRQLENFHYDLLTSSSPTATKFNNLVEGLFIAASHHSVGVQFADLVAGAVYRKVSKNDSSFYDIIERNVRCGQHGVNGFGIISLPKGSVKF
ncbi:DUF3800 domain-containing protein [Bifidobacterium pseudolongum]|uniref:DUF3800 domain-containing protein n=1 Tax=Bifidobacterium pseudolongum subsp. globosum TaxID=1690 RepID=A0A2N3QTS9_9BIFI|nr:DUF3800 domain-containing protein [Bifidobacterium pseudolongum]PKU95406.1 hypothetical protein CQR45_1050 [Bifidobacterium pseudolongum subsp. globosum]PKV00189.1 hypothetical protein CQR54_1060 [Bifidobacterium pseudolongum subsp. globosum]RYQ24852.1 hypothetical protein PG2048B_1154 [Bifidobacterium pseudolongum subsp. globosum]